LNKNIIQQKLNPKNIRKYLLERALRTREENDPLESVCVKYQAQRQSLVYSFKSCTIHDL